MVESDNHGLPCGGDLEPQYPGVGVLELTPGDPTISSVLLLNLVALLSVLCGECRQPRNPTLGLPFFLPVL